MLRTTLAVPKITIFLSSPSDVQEERAAVRRVVEEINDDPAYAHCTLSLLAYENCTSPQMGKSAQRVVDDFMRKASEADVVVCILCNRLGTPTTDELTGRTYESGTHYEFDSAYQAFRASGTAPRIMLYLGTRGLPDEPDEEQLAQQQRAIRFKNNIRKSAVYEGLYCQYKAPSELEVLVRVQLKRHLEKILAGSTVTASPPLPSVDPHLANYLSQLAANYRWLELQGIREAGTLRIELERVYVALKAEPEKEYDRRQEADLHAAEVNEAAGTTAIDLIPPEQLEELEATNLRQTYRPTREEARRANVTEVRTFGDVVRKYRRVVILGGPGSGKSTLGRWLALQFARGMLRQIDLTVPPDPAPEPASTILFTPEGVPLSFAVDNFARHSDAGRFQAVRIDSIPSRGVLRLAGTEVTIGQVIDSGQLRSLTFTPTAEECGMEYTWFRYSVHDGTSYSTPAVMTLNVLVHVRVPLAQLDPELRSATSGSELIDLGPARVPVFLRISHFARDLEERKQQPPRSDPPSVLNYLGHDLDSCGLGDGCSPAARNALLRAAVENGRAMVVLDGLDELTELNRRDVVMHIQKFVEEHTLAKEASTPPRVSGGNQIVVTSRYVGYKQAPVRADCDHFGIQPMRRPAVERFAHSWTAAVNAELAVEGRTGIVAADLIAAIYSDARPAVRELATNPLLVTILAIVFWAEKGHLPDQRAGVYDRVVENLLRIWLQRQECRTHKLTRTQLLASLEPLAADMQQNAGANGLIALARIGELVSVPLAQLLGMDPHDRRFLELRNDLLGTIRKHVGLLAEQSPGNYAFFHRTIQEFLAARHLLSDHRRAAERITEHLDDPLWREPLLLALGFSMIDPDWGPEERERLLADVLAADGPPAFLPRAALLVVTALPDLRDAPPAMVGQTVERLLLFYARLLDQTQAITFREQIEQAFVRLRQGLHADMVAQQMSEVLRRRPVSDIAGAVATLLRRMDWFTTELVESLLGIAGFDRAVNDWCFNRALVTALARRPSDVPWLGSPPSLNMPRLAAHLPMRRLLETDPELLGWVYGNTDWLWLLVALYGGFGHVKLTERLGRRPQSSGEQQDVSDPSATEVADRLFTHGSVAFSPQDIVKDLADAELSSHLRRHLVARKPATDLVPFFEQRWERGSNPEGAAEAMCGLAALGQDIVHRLQVALSRQDRHPARQAALEKVGWLRALLSEPLLRSHDILLRSIPPEAPPEHQVDLLLIALEVLAAGGCPPLKVSADIPQCRFVPVENPESQATLDAEHWAYLLSAIGRREAVSDGDLLALLHHPHSRLLAAWAVLHGAKNLRIGGPAWTQAVLPPRADLPQERYLVLLDLAARAPVAYHRIMGYVVGRCRGLVEQHPELLCETLTVLRSQGETMWEAFCSVPSDFRMNEAGLDSLQADGVPEHILDLLKRMQDEAFISRVRFINRAVELLGPSDWDAYGEKVLSYAGGRLISDNDPIWTQAATWQFAADIRDPYLRFRAEHRLFLNLQPFGGSQGPDAIGDPHQRFLAFELLLLTLPVVPENLFTRVVDAAPDIPDAENRARSQFRLALFGTGFTDQLLRDGFDSIGRIADQRRRVETLREVRAVWGRFPGMAEVLDVAALAVTDPWHRDKARGRTSRLIHTYRRQTPVGPMLWRLNESGRVHRTPPTTGSLAWGILYLSSVASEVEGQGNTAATADAFWPQLLGSDRPAAVASLISAGLESGLTVGPRETAILDRLIQSDQTADLEPLWPFLYGLGTFHRWTAYRNRAGQWSALVQAEAGRLTPDVVSAVIDLHETSSDLIRLRAAVALHGRTPYTNNRNRRWSVRRVGGEALDVVARHINQPDCPVTTKSTLRKIGCDIHHDDPISLTRWLTEAAGRDRKAETANEVLRWMESIETDLVPQVLAALRPDTPAGLQQAILRGLAQVAFCSSALQDHGEEVRTAVANIAADVRAGVWVVPSGPVTVLEVAEKVSQLPGRNGRPAQARREWESRTLWVQEEHVANAKGCLDRLREIGSGFYVPVEPRPSAAYTKAAKQAENESLLRFLLEWLESEYRSGGQSLRIPDLLPATEAVAHHSPLAFTNAANPDLWEPMLCDWAQNAEYWTARLAAVRLLGRLRRVTDRVGPTLRSAMNDVSFVQEAAYEAAGEFRRIQGDILPGLVQLLANPSAGVVAATARLLVGIAKSEGTAADSKRILRGLEEVATRSTLLRPVHLMDENLAGIQIRFVDRLDRILYRCLLEVSGL